MSLHLVRYICIIIKVFLSHMNIKYMNMINLVTIEETSDYLKANGKN